MAKKNYLPKDYIGYLPNDLRRHGKKRNRISIIFADPVSF